MTEGSEINAEVFTFGEFSLDLSGRVLRRRGEIVVLQPRVLDTLILLVENRGEMLTKREMMDAIWKDAFVEEANLTQTIYLLRRILGKNSEGEDWIKTAPRKGYLFTAQPSSVTLSELVTDSALSDGQPSRKRLLAVCLVALLLAALSVIGYAILRRPTNEPAGARGIDLKKLTFTGDIEFPVIAPDGNSFAFSRSGKIIIQQLATGQTRELSLPEKVEAGFLRYLPDGKSIAFRDERRFYLKGNVMSVSLDGGTPERLAENVWSGFAFSHDSKRVAFVRDVPEENVHQLVVRDIRQGVDRVLAQLTDPSRYIFVGGPEFSPDDRHLAIAASIRDGKAPRSLLAVYDSETGTSEEIAPPQIKQFEHVAWMPDGVSLAVVARENDKFFQIWSLSYPQGKLGRITNDLNSCRNLTASADGKKLLATNYVIFSHIWRSKMPDVGKLEQVTFGNLNRDGTIGMDWLSDGSIIYSARLFGNVDLFRVGPGELDKVQLTREAGDINSVPRISPDGQTIYFTSNRTGNNQIWRMRIDGSDQTQITFGEKEANEMPDLSPDGKMLYFVRKGGNNTGLWRRDLAKGIEEMVPIIGKLNPDTFMMVSPDGKFIATCNLTSRREEGDLASYEIAIVSLEEKTRPRIFNSPTNWVAWAPDSAAFDVAIYKDGDTTVERRMLDGSAPRRLFERKGEYISKMLWDQAGNSLAVSMGKRQNDAVLIDLASK